MALSALRLHRYSSLSCSFLNGKGNEGGTAGSDETRPWWTGIFCVRTRYSIEANGE